jgi:hypothetical protein
MMDIDTCNCVLCKAANPHENFDLRPEVSDEVWRAAGKVQGPTRAQSTTKEASAQGIALLRRRVGLGGEPEASGMAQEEGVSGP